MNKDKKLVFGILALLVSIVVVSISYAGFTQNLNINGTGSVQATDWSVHFANLTNGIRNGTANERTAPTIKSGNTSIGDYAVDFYDYNDFGMNNEKYDGVIFFRNTIPGNRYYGIYMTGNAQLYFTYERNDKTLDDLLQEMGIKNFKIDNKKTLKYDYPLTLYTPSNKNMDTKNFV